MPNKYSPFLEYLIQTNVDVHFASDIHHGSDFKGWLKSTFDCFELVLWCLLNGIQFSKISLIFSKKVLNKKDILFFMHYGNLTFETENFAKKGALVGNAFGDMDIFKVVHLTHYAYCPLTGAHNLALVKPDLLVAENNLKKNSTYFNKYFNFYKNQFLCLPYVAASRFKNLKPFDLRFNKIVVTGSITYKMKSPEFIDFFAADELQPMRRKLYEQAAFYTKQMDCLISDLNASRTLAVNTDEKNKTTCPHHGFGAVSDQVSYYKKDIVEIYNSYTMFTVPEEICSLPAIGFVEGMACGSVYFGLDDPMYRDIGMYPGIHYIGYDGTVADLMIKVDYYQIHPEELSKIGQNGYRFVSENLNQAVIYDDFVQQLALAAAAKKSAIAIAIANE